ncbi:MAG: DEAD/DEAH box helicase [Candidatus Hydrogenedens sp.]|nr:DEAD/DEAH box helicase [Candidatus Hydrogenedens sp.]
MTFSDFDINPLFAQVLAREGITVPTPVQAAAIPLALEGADVTAIAQTGTGKTLGFALPSLTLLSEGRPAPGRMLVLTPTRELAQQVQRGMMPLAKAARLRTTCIVGGCGFGPQTQDLRRGVDIIVATPGRLLDHMQRGNVSFDNLEIVVLDEADRMLDMGFLPDIRRILKDAPEDRQTLLFSATFPKEIERLAKDFQYEAERIEIGAISTPAETVTQQVYTVRKDEKKELLAHFLQKTGVETTLVFIRTKHATDRVAKYLRSHGIEAEPIHGGRSQAQRERALDGFRKGKFSVLVATDVAARGLDVQGITHVVNFDLPKTFEDYVHRIGRTGRANATGDAVTFVTPEEAKDLAVIERGLGRSIERAVWEGAVPVASHAQRAERPAGGPPRRGPRRGSGGGRGRRSGTRQRAVQA